MGKFISVTLDYDAGIVTYTLGNGQSLALVVPKVPERTRDKLATLGGSNKVKDTAARYSKARDYAGAYDAMTATIQALYDDNWNRASTGTPDIVEAIIRLYSKTDDPKDHASARKLWEASTEGQQGNFKAQKIVKKLLAEIKAERAAAAAEDADETALTSLLG